MKNNRVYEDNIPVWIITMVSNINKETVKLLVTGLTNYDATKKCITLFGQSGDYKWTGTEPLYK